MAIKVDPATHIITFQANYGQTVELGFNYAQPHDNKEIFLCVNEDHVGDFYGVGISPEVAREMRDHLNFLLGES